MYGKNDYRDYLEHRLAESDDFLAHYGVKGMKWKKRKAAQDTINADQARGMKLTQHYGVGNRTGNIYIRSPKGQGVANVTKYKTSRTKRVGTDTNSIKTRIKDKARRIRKKHNAKNSIFDRSVWKREKPKGKKLSKRSNITVSHNTTIK